MEVVNKVIYLNNAATTYPKSAISLEYYNSIILNPPNDIRNSVNKTSEVDQSRVDIAKVLGISEKFIFFVSGATVGINCIIHGILNEEDECIIDNRAHNSIVRTLYNINVKYKVCDLYSKDDKQDNFKLFDSITDKTKLICLNHASNVSGEIYDLKEIIGLIKVMYPYILIFVDASQSVGMVSLDNVIDADFIIFPGHKYLHSVPGAAVLIAKEKLKGFIYGGTGQKSNLLSYEEESIGKNFLEVGTLNTPAIFALAKSFIHTYENIVTYKKKIDMLTARLLKNIINNIEHLKPIGTYNPSTHTGVLSFISMIGKPENLWVKYLNVNNIIVRGGLHCCYLHHKQLGLENAGSLRFSVSRFNTVEEIDYVSSVLKDLCRQFYNGKINNDYKVTKTYRYKKINYKNIKLEKVVPCAEDPFVFDYEGTIEGDIVIAHLESIVTNLGWTVINVSDQAIMFYKNNISVLIKDDGTFSLSGLKGKIDPYKLIEGILSTT